MVEVPHGASPPSDAGERLGSWFFRHRSLTPVPLAVVLTVVRYHEWRRAVAWALGAALVSAGEALRLWAVRHVGVASRTRRARVERLVTSGPYAWIRNPLYVGNLLMWSGFVCESRLAWMLPVLWILFALQYGAIIKWEEYVLTERFSNEYGAYAYRVGRWIPRKGARAGSESHGPCHSWREVLFSERGTLLEIAVMSLILAAKALSE